MRDFPLISVIIVAWNSKNYLTACLDRLVPQTFCDFEVVVVDNGSVDHAVDKLEEKYPSLALRLEKLPVNYGFAAANNIGARLAHGQWLALLNADAFPEPDWLERLLEATEKYPNAFFASQQIQVNHSGLLDGEGDVYHVSGLAWRRNYGFPVQEKQEVEEIFSPCGAAALYPRQAFLDAGGFDEDYFSYQEDVDLGFRLRLRGLRCFYVPRAVVRHVGSATFGINSDFAFYHSHRNLVWTFVKNMPGILFWRYLCAHLFLNLVYLVLYTIRRRGIVVWKAKLDALRGLPKAVQKRKLIQKNRKATSADILRIMERGWLQPYLLGYHSRYTLTKSKRDT